MSFSTLLNFLSWMLKTTGTL